jgi:hypothetical protein
MKNYVLLQYLSCIYCFIITLQAIVNGDPYDKPVLQIIVSYTINFTEKKILLTYNNCSYFQVQASTLTYFLTCPFGQLTKKSTCSTQSFSCLKKLIKMIKTRE